MALVMLLTALAVASVVAGLKIYYSGPRVAPERIAPEDLDLVSAEDCEAWRRVSRKTYQAWKHQDDFYRVAAYKKAVASGMSPEDAKARVKQDFPFFYVDPASRDDGTYSGDDGALPIVLRGRVNTWAPILKPMMVEKAGRFRTMNALVREIIRRKAL